MSTSPTSLRFPPKTEARLEKWVERRGDKTAFIVRAVEAELDRVEANHSSSSLVLPVAPEDDP